MAGMQFEYDEEGGTFFYFLLSFWALGLFPATYFCWPRAKVSGKRDNRVIYCWQLMQMVVGRLCSKVYPCYKTHVDSVHTCIVNLYPACTEYTAVILILFYTLVEKEKKFIAEHFGGHLLVEVIGLNKVKTVWIYNKIWNKEVSYSGQCYC